jgi:hypothetical protein
MERLLDEGRDCLRLFRVTLSMRQYRYALTKDLSKFYQRVDAALDDLCGILPLGKCKLFIFYKKNYQIMMENIYCAKLDNVQKYICDCESLKI